MYLTQMGWFVRTFDVHLLRYALFLNIQNWNKIKFAFTPFALWIDMDMCGAPQCHALVVALLNHNYRIHCTFSANQTEY